MEQIVIVGGGPSISEGIPLGLWQKLEGYWTIGCNSAFKFFTPTILTFVDHQQFYKQFSKELKQLPLLIGKHYPSLAQVKHSNTYLMRDSRQFDITLKQGVYSGSLCGLFSTTLACHLAKDVEIFLLGFDFGAIGSVNGRQRTHFYQGQIEHRGIGYTGFYDNTKTTNLFEPYVSLKGKKIYNVSLTSKIPYFEKITYEKFFELLKTQYDQLELRQRILKQLSPYFIK